MTPSQTTTYTGTITYNGFSCSDNVVVTVNQPVITNLNESICQGSSYILPWGGNVSVPGNYSHTYTIPSGCDSIVTIHLIVNPLPTATITVNGPITLCNGVSTTLSSSSAASYSWSNGLTTQDIVIFNTGNYHVTITDINNCTATSADVSIVAQPCSIKLDVRLFVEGFYRPGGHLVPTIDPLNLPNVCDIIKVELHQQAWPYGIFRAVQGTINISGWGTYMFPSIAYGQSYYIALIHRNSVETWSKFPVPMFNQTTYDFTTSSNQAYDDGYGILPMKLVDSNPDRWAIFGGDINQDGAVDARDMTIEENDVNSGAFGYYASDLTGDGGSDALDMTIIENNTNNGVFKMRP